MNQQGGSSGSGITTGGSVSTPKTIRNFQRQTSAQILGSLPIDVEEKRNLRKNGLFTEAQLMKYRKWFNAMDSDKSGTVNVNELSQVLLSSGVLRYKYEVESMFRQADVDKSGEISFEEFVSGIGSTIASGKLQLHRLDSLVDETNILSAETMLSQARREILLEHIIHGTKQRTMEIEKITNKMDENKQQQQQYSRHQRRTQHNNGTIISINEIKNHRTLENVVAKHQITRQKSMQTISQLSQILELTKKELPKTEEDDDDEEEGERLFTPRSPRNSIPIISRTKTLSSLSSSSSPISKHPSLVPLESLLDPSLWDMIDPSLRTISTPIRSSRGQGSSQQMLTPLETSPTLCSAAFQSSSDSLSFPPRPKIILRRIGSHESIQNTPQDPMEDADEGDDDNSSLFSNTSTSRSIATKPNATISLKPIISKKKPKISKLHLRKSNTSSTSTSSSCKNLNASASEFYLANQNRFTLKRNEVI